LTEAWQQERKNTIETEALRLIRSGREADAVRLLQDFVDGNVGRIDREYRMLSRSLPGVLATAGTRYLFLDYLSQWTARSGVPLPLR
jgi:hypothetical protein